ncbi:MAG: helix-turn-helix transcriptional regulator [Anaeroplasmataceae bacterium]|nr:helix-turn-helix transcriptional regulator [Anaeroplasmataceae bacterium]
MNQYDFIELIKKKRENQFLSQKDLAKQIPISKTAYCKIENHQQNLNFFIIKRIAELLEIDLNLIKDLKKETIFFD